MYQTIIADSETAKYELGSSWAMGALFGLGLVISGMCRVSKIRGFLTISEFWDPSLMFVMASAVTINFITFKYILNRDQPKRAQRFAVPDPSAKVDL